LPSQATLLSNCDARDASVMKAIFSNRPFGGKRFQTIRRHSLGVARGLVLLSGIGTMTPSPSERRTRARLPVHARLSRPVTSAPSAARAERSSPVAATEPSATARAKKATKRNANGDRINSFAGLIDHLGNLDPKTPYACRSQPSIPSLSKSTPLGGDVQTLGLRSKRVQ
jgi:hypothetical protein